MAYRGEGSLKVDKDPVNHRLFVVGADNDDQVILSKRFGWSTHNCSCSGSKTGLVFYPKNPQHKNIVLLVCEKCYNFKSGDGTQHQQLAKWYFNIYGTGKSFHFTSGFSMKSDESLGYNSASQNGIQWAM